MNAPRLKAMAGLPWVPCADIETSGPVEYRFGRTVPVADRMETVLRGTEEAVTRGHTATWPYSDGR